MKKPIKILLWVLGLCCYYYIAAIFINDFIMFTTEHIKNSSTLNYPALIANLIFWCIIEIIIPIVFVKKVLNQNKNKLSLAFFMPKIKDLSVLILYLILFFLVLPKVFCNLDIFFADNIVNSVSPKYNFIIKPVFVFDAFCVITTFFLPAIITKIALDKNLSKYLNYFFDHIQYPTFVLICFILIKTFFDMGAQNIFFYNCAFYSTYFLTAARKFIKPIYKQFWYFYYFCTVCFIVLFIMLVM